MKPLHTLKVTNATGDAVFTNVELDGQIQYVSQFDISHRLNPRGTPDTVEVRLVYPAVAVEVSLDEAAVKRQFGAKLYIPGYEGITAHGYGETIAAALRDMADRLDAGQS
jgi:hypothetical protein